MYYCNDCNQFITPVLADDGVTDVCMYCGSEDIEPASECGICGKPIKSNEDYCEGCLKLAERYIFELGLEVGNYKKAKDLLLAVMEKED